MRGTYHLVPGKIAQSGSGKFKATTRMATIKADGSDLGLRIT